MSRTDDLLAAKELMWESIEAASPAARAPLMAQWRALEKDLADMTEGETKPSDPIDEISARRAARGGATARKGRAQGGAG